MEKGGRANLSVEEFREFQDFIYQRSGMYFPLAKKRYFEERLLLLLKKQEIPDFRSYFGLLKDDQERYQLNQLFDEITVNETYFFRDPAQFEVLEKHLVPGFIKPGKKPIRILSAGCSTGEEAYSLAILLREKYPGIAFEIMGLDISEMVIEKAKKARYGDYSIRRVPKAILQKYFKQNNGLYILNQTVKTNVFFQNFNLMELDEYTLQDKFDIILCRYVLIYFDLGSKKQVINMFYKKIDAQGYLILGNSESLFTISENFGMLHFPGTIIYKRR